MEPVAEYKNELRFRNPIEGFIVLIKLFVWSFQATNTSLADQPLQKYVVWCLSISFSGPWTRRESLWGFLQLRNSLQKRCLKRHLENPEHDQHFCKTFLKSQTLKRYLTVYEQLGLMERHRVAHSFENWLAKEVFEVWKEYINAFRRKMGPFLGLRNLPSFSSFGNHPYS